MTGSRCFFAAAAVLAAGVFSDHAFGAPAKKTAGVTAISAGTGLSAAATGVGAPVAAFIGGFEIGWGIGCILFDPPDTANAGTPVDINTLLIYALPDIQTLDPGLPSGLASTINSYADLMDAYVADARAYSESLDRASGALVLGQPAWAAARQAEAKAFRSDALQEAGLAVAATPGLLAAIGAYDPSLPGITLTLADVEAFRDSVHSSGLPSFEQFALTGWNVSSSEQSLLVSRLGGLSDATLQGLFQQLDPINGNTTNLGNAFQQGTTICAECMAPEPSSNLLLLSGGLVLLPLWRWGRRRRTN